jgi:hypothetical protein
LSKTDLFFFEGERQGICVPYTDLRFDYFCFLSFSLRLKFAC